MRLAGGVPAVGTNLSPAFGNSCGFLLSEWRTEQTRQTPGVLSFKRGQFMAIPQRIRISVIVPCRNERDYIDGFIESLLQQETDGLSVEYLIADGGSNDGTRELLTAHAARVGRLHIIDNPRGTVPSGLNELIRRARGDIIIRMDVHSEYAPDYIRQCVRVLEATGADNVGGPARTRARRYFQSAVALAYHSAFSSGGVSFHNPGYEGYVDTVTYGCWRKATLERLGLFDEELIRNQDDELNLRLVRAGGKIWQSPDIRSWYYPRETWLGLFRQYTQYGYWKVRVIQKHKIPGAFRHLVPGLLVSGLAALGAASFFHPLARAGFIMLGALYAAANMAASIWVSSGRGKWRYLPIMPAVFAAYHFGYGYGFLRGLLDFWILRKPANRTFATITRGTNGNGGTAVHPLEPDGHQIKGRVPSRTCGQHSEQASYGTTR